MRRLPAAPSDPRRLTAGLKAGAARLAEALFAIETDPEFHLLRDGDAFEGRSAAVVADARARVQHLWQCYPLLKEAVDQLEQAQAAEDHAEVRRLRGPQAVILPDGTATGLPDLLAALERDLDQATAAAHRVGDARRTLGPRLERLTETVARLDEQAEDLDQTRDIGLRNARRLVADLDRHATPDPLGVDAGRAEQEVAAVRTRFDELARRRDGLPDALTAARSLLDELRGTIAAGADALTATQERVKDCGGLLRPLDPSVIDADERCLEPWLARLDAAAEAGDWRAAAAGLDQWRTVADGWLTNARRVVEANRAPLQRRNELRGLLDGFRAKAAATGLGADARLAETYDDAHRLLHEAPCDLDAAEARVREYGQAVNRTRAGS